MGLSPLTPHLGTPVNGTVVTEFHKYSISEYFSLDESISDGPQEYSCCSGCCTWDSSRTKFRIL